MSSADKFHEVINKGYQTKGDYIVLGGGMLNGESVPDSLIKAPLKTFNRHGLIAGATGTGKTKTLQIIAENLSQKGVPVLLMDVKGDLSGLAQASGGHPKIDERHEKIGIPFAPSKAPCELLTISNEPGVRLRATVSEFGPVLFSKILDLNDTQAGIVAAIFKYCDDKKMPLLDLKDFKKVLQYATNEGKKEIEAEYGRISPASVGTIMRKMIELDQQGADVFFGEKSFEVDDLTRTDANGHGIISILRLTDIPDKPKLFSTFMLCLLAEVYGSFPEEGDADKPKLVIFIDEAHLIFNEASDALMDQIEAVVKLIRSKAVGLFFVTQNPADVPDAVLSQLGMKVQHALRAFTAKDRKAIKLASENYPISEFYDIDQELTELGIGEAFISVLNEKGIPTPLARTLLRAPMSRMDILSKAEIKDLVGNSNIIDKYNKETDRDSAYEMLNEKIEDFQAKEIQEEKKKEKEKASKQTTRRPATKRRQKTQIEKAMSSSMGRMIIREVTRGLLGAFGLGGRRRF